MANPPKAWDSIPYAKRIPGKAGYVYGPVTGREIDVRGFPRGFALVDGDHTPRPRPPYGWAYVDNEQSYNSARSSRESTDSSRSFRVP